MSGSYPDKALALISKYYQGKIAQRSGVPYINHITEGLEVLKVLGGSERSKAVFCLHPLLQNDKDFDENKGLITAHPLLDWDLVLEYREFANDYLSHRKISSIQEIRLPRTRCVRYALMADKIQNYKDFMLYHYKVHPRSDELYEYFHNWFKALGLSYGEIEMAIRQICIPPTNKNLSDFCSQWRECKKDA